MDGFSEFTEGHRIPCYRSEGPDRRFWDVFDRVKVEVGEKGERGVGH